MTEPIFALVRLEHNAKSGLRTEDSGVDCTFERVNRIYVPITRVSGIRQSPLEVIGLTILSHGDIIISLRSLESFSD